MTTIDTRTSAAPGKNHWGEYDLVTTVIATASQMLITLFDWQHAARQRRQLLGLSDSALKDFGASRADAEREAGKPAWHC